MKSTQLLSTKEAEALIGILKDRFNKNMHRHSNCVWNELQAKLVNHPTQLWSLNEMEKTGGEPDVVQYNEHAEEYLFMDCSKESPAGRRSLCYDRAGLESRKEHQPKNSAVDMANEMGIDILTEQQYQLLQETEAFDTKTSSWLKTPDNIRALGGAIFGDFRYDHVFIYHNGAQSYYAARGFRGAITI
ncbi:MAG: DUF4256 domain-containing protein [Bacteroidetes bacterium]|nr:DUF4256 domain-containing protein [Bacteroidota bacterium]